MVDEELLRHVGDIVTAEKLGSDSTSDYLAIAVSSTDSVGHDYGPVSEEQLDTLVRLDAALGTMDVEASEYLAGLGRGRGEEGGRRRHEGQNYAVQSVLQRPSRLARR